MPHAKKQKVKGAIWAMLGDLREMVCAAVLKMLDFRHVRGASLQPGINSQRLAS